ncbi:MAG: hypothetical protein WCQ21_31095 [Verrucomicrobiota bacterium]
MQPLIVGSRSLPVRMVEVMMVLTANRLPLPALTGWPQGPMAMSDRD